VRHLTIAGARQDADAEQVPALLRTDCLVELPQRGDEREREREHQHAAQRAATGGSPALRVQRDRTRHVAALTLSP